MPVRARAAERITRDIVGNQIWDGLRGECSSMPTEVYEDVADAADVLYERIIQDLDWNRVLLEASSRHLSLMREDAHPPQGRREIRTVDDVCPDCLREALLMEDRIVLDWVSGGTAVQSPRHDTGQDWAATIASAICHRRKES